MLVAGNNLKYAYDGNKITIHEPAALRTKLFDVVVVNL